MPKVVHVVYAKICGPCMFYRRKSETFGVCKIDCDCTGQLPLPGITPTLLPEGVLL